MRKRVSLLLIVSLAAFLSLAQLAQAEITVGSGYNAEAYVTGLQNPSGLAFSPGRSFGYEGELFVTDSRPSSGHIYRVPSIDNKISWAPAATNEPEDIEFAPTGSPFGDDLYASLAYRVGKYDSSGTWQQISSTNPFGWDMAFAPDERYRNNLFQTDGWEPGSGGERILEWKPDGTSTVFASNLPEETNGLAFGPGGDWGTDLFVAFSSSRGSTPAIRTVNPDGQLSDFVTSTQFGQTSQLAFDTSGKFNNNLYVTDFENDVIFEVDPNGNVSTFASGFSFSQTPYHNSSSADLVFGPDGALYICDGGAGTVWKVSSTTVSFEAIIDIKPGNSNNPLNPRANGVVPVAIFGSDQLDVTNVDQASLLLAGAAAKEKGNSGKIGIFRDVNQDGWEDIVLHFVIDDMDLTDYDSGATLTGLLLDGTEIFGTDNIALVGAIDQLESFGDTICIDFMTTASVNPEPASLSLLLISGLTLIRRRTKKIPD